MAANENEPVFLDDPAFVDLENQQSVDPNLQLAVDPDQPWLVVADDPALVAARREGRTLAQLSPNPIPLLVADIHDEVQQLLQAHREIYDGVELALDQVQDKRLEFLSAGPEVTPWEMFVQFALVFLLESPVVGSVLQSAYRFVGNGTRIGFLVSREAKFSRLSKAAEVLRKNLAQNARQSATARAKRRNIRNELDRYFTKVQRRQKVTDEEVEAANILMEELLVENNKLAKLERDSKNIGDMIDAPSVKDFAKVTDIKAEALKTFFAETDKEFVNYGVAALKGVQASPSQPRDAATPNVHSPAGTTRAPNSMGVEIKSMALRELRRVELFLGLIATHADLLGNLAGSDKTLAPESARILGEMLAALRRAEEKKDSSKATHIDVRLTMQFECEKLVWAFLVVEGFPNAYPVPIRTGFYPIHPMAVNTQHLNWVGPTLAGIVHYNPPPSMMEYLSKRFFSGQSLTPEETYKRLKEHRDAVLKSNPSGQPLFEVHNLPLKA